MVLMNRLGRISRFSLDIRPWLAILLVKANLYCAALRQYLQ